MMGFITPHVKRGATGWQKSGDSRIPRIGEIGLEIHARRLRPSKALFSV